MSDTSVYLVQLDDEDGTLAYVVNDDIDDTRITTALGASVEGIAHHRFGQEMKVKRVYRKMSLDEFKKTIQRGGMLDPVTRNPAVSEKWLTESLEHSRAFQNKGVKTGTNETVAKFKVDAAAYNKNVRDHTIAQKGAKMTNEARIVEGKRPYNVWNDEQLKKVPGKRNIGLKGPENVKAFNDTVISVKETNPYAFRNKNAFTQWVSNNKLGLGMAAVGIALDAVSITVAVLNDKGKWGPHVTRTLSSIAGGYAGATAGAKVGALIGSVLPVVGTAIGGMLGALLGGIIGSYATDAFSGIWVSLRHVAPGPGPPPLDIIPAARGPPKLDIDEPTRGPPQLDVDPMPEGPPELDVAPMSRGPPPLF